MIHLIEEAESLPEPICDPPALPGSRATDRAKTNNTDIVFPPAARHAQAERGSARAYEKRIAAGFPDRVTPDLAAFGHFNENRDALDATHIYCIYRNNVLL